MHGLAIDLIYELAMYGKSLSAGPKSLEATLPPIAFIRDVFHLSLQEQDHQEGAGIRERYEKYKNAAIYKNETQLEFEFDLRYLPIVRPSQAQPFQALPCERQLLRPASYNFS